MACLSAGEVSILAWEILEKTANFFLRLSDSTIVPAMKRLSAKNIVSGESGAATLAAFAAICSDEKTKQLTGIDENSRILLISTEGSQQFQKIYLYSKYQGSQTNVLNIIFLLNFEIPNGPVSSTRKPFLQAEVDLFAVHRRVVSILIDAGERIALRLCEYRHLLTVVRLLGADP